MQAIILNSRDSNLLKQVNITKDNYTLLLDNGKPVGLFTAINNEILQSGLIQWLVIKAYQNGDISIGQLSQQLELKLEETFDFLSGLNIPVVDYDLDDDLRTIENWENENNS